MQTNTGSVDLGEVAASLASWHAMRILLTPATKITLLHGFSAITFQICIDALKDRVPPQRSCAAFTYNSMRLLDALLSLACYQ
jgi:hypothetical protein